MLHTTIDSPVGRVFLVGRDGALCGLDFQDGPRPAALDPAWRRDDAAFAGVTAQLEGYSADGVAAVGQADGARGARAASTRLSPS